MTHSTTPPKALKRSHFIAASGLAAASRVLPPAMAQSARYWRDRRVPLAQAAGRTHADAARHRRPLGHSRGRQALSKVVVDGANSPKAAQLRDTFAIPNKPKNLKETREDWARDVPVWVKLAVDLGIKLD